MEIILIDKIKSYLSTNRSVEVEFAPFHKGLDINLDKDTYLSDFDFYQEHFGDWYYEELTDFLVSRDAFGGTILVDFILIENSLLAKICLICSDYAYYADFDRHAKGEIMSPTLVEAIIENRNLTESTFDEDLLDFNLVFDTDFRGFEIYYDDELLLFNPKVTEQIKSEIKQVISMWDGPFFGNGFSDLKIEITIERGDDEFVCTNTAEYEFKIEA